VRSPCLSFWPSATNAAIVVDPGGFVIPGQRAVVPFDLTDADIRVDVLVLGQTARALHVEIVAPDGTVLTPAPAPKRSRTTPSGAAGGPRQPAS
jgi:hypothetical protein